MHPQINKKDNNSTETWANNMKGQLTGKLQITNKHENVLF